MGGCIREWMHKVVDVWNGGDLNKWLDERIGVCSMGWTFK